MPVSSEAAGPAHVAPAQEPPLLLVLDACVLMSSILRPLLLDLAAEGWFRPVWSERIGDEWRRNAARIWGTSPQALSDEWQAMCERFPDADPGELSAYEAGLHYSDPKDWHVIAAGLARRARSTEQRRPVLRVLTWNLKDFNRSELKRQDVSAWDPDRQLADWLQRYPQAIRETLLSVSRHALARGRDEPISETFKRERLFRTGSLMSKLLTPGEPSGS